MTHQPGVGDFVRVQSQSIVSGKPFDAVIVNTHFSGYYVDPLAGNNKTPYYVTHDEVVPIKEPPKPQFTRGSLAKLGSTDGPDVIVIAILSRGLLIEVRDGTVSHVMEVLASDLCEPANSSAQGVFV